MRYVASGTGEEVKPLLVLASYHRWHGTRGHGSSGREDVLAAVLVVNGTARLPNRAAAFGENPAHYTYSVLLTFFMPDTMECTEYMIKELALVGPASPGGEYKHEIGRDGVVRVDVPYSRLDWNEPPTEEARLLKRIRGLARYLDSASGAISKEDEIRIAVWALARLDELQGKIGETDEIRDLRLAWASHRP